MPLNLCSAQSSVRGLAVLVAAVPITVTEYASLKAQTSSQYEGPVCVAPPTFPENDTWPVAVTHTLGATNTGNGKINGPHNLTAVARDAARNTATSATILVNVANIVMTLNGTAPSRMTECCNSLRRRSS